MLIFVTAFFLAVAPAQPPRTAPASATDPITDGTIDRYDVVWDSPSTDAAGSMPIGNGEVGVNVWTEPGGDLVCYVSRTDSWSENARLLKLGKVRIHMDPSPWSEGVRFEQRLVLRDGVVRVSFGESGKPDAGELVIGVEQGAPAVRVTGEFGATPRRVSVSIEPWRTTKKVISGTKELASSWVMRDAPTSIEVWESPDVVVEDVEDLIWYHRNEHSIVDLTIDHQGLRSIAGVVPDPLTGLTFGATISARGGAERQPFERVSGTRLESRRPVDLFETTILTDCRQVPKGEEFVRELKARGELLNHASGALASTREHWNAFWKRSWIIIDGDEGTPQFAITRAYMLQRFVAACGSRGTYPIKFNGSIFTVEPKATDGTPWDPDYRRWGGDFWWQNTRLPYYAMLMQGDFEGMDSLFSFYERVAPGCAARAKLYYNAEGVYFPETITMFGTYGNGDYGWDRTGKEVSFVDCPYWAYAWNQGPELVDLMLQYYEYTHDRDFLRTRALPMADQVLAYFESRFGGDHAATLRITPTQAVETYWHGVINDAPTVAGLHAIVGALRSLPSDATTPAQRAYWASLQGRLPPIPTRTSEGVTMLSPAEIYEDRRSNVETAELYSVFPFRLYGVRKPGLEQAIAAYDRRIDRSTAGWTQDGMFAAALGLTDQARDQMIAKAANSHASHRFPAVWGPNFDWLPDQCHGSNLMTTLQMMLVQTNGEEIIARPAWPSEWNVRFKVHLPGPAQFTGEIKDRRVVSGVLSPPMRARNLKIMPPAGAPRAPESKN